MALVGCGGGGGPQGSDVYYGSCNGKATGNGCVEQSGPVDSIASNAWKVACTADFQSVQRCPAGLCCTALRSSDGTLNKLCLYFDPADPGTPEAKTITRKNCTDSGGTVEGG